jgi:hypothetical protein
MDGRARIIIEKRNRTVRPYNPGVSSFLKIV